MNVSTPPSEYVIIAQDIINLIIDEVAMTYGDAQNLKAHPLHNCALSCHSFYLRTTHHIFSRIDIIQSELDSSTLMTRITRLVDILASNPAIGPSVRTLVIQAGYDKPIKSAPSDNVWELASGFWKAKNPALVNVLKHFNDLQEIIFRGGIGVSTWKDLHQDTSSALRTIIASQSLRRMELHRLSGLPSRILLDCQRLIEITLRDVDIRLGSLANVPAIGPFPALGPEYSADSNPLLCRLESMDLNTTHTINRILAFWCKRSAFSRLRHLRMVIDSWRDDASAAWSVMVQSARTLQVLDLRWSAESGYPVLSPCIISLAHLPSLRLLILNFGIGWEAPNYVPQILDLKESSSNLETLYLCANWRRVYAWEMKTGGGLWNRMDKALCDQGYKRLKKIVLVQTNWQLGDCGAKGSCREIDAVLVQTDYKFDLPGVLEKGNITVETYRLP